MTKDALKKLGSAASPSVTAAKTIQKLAGAQVSDKEAERIKRMIPKKAKGGEMKKPMKAALGAAALLAGKDKIKEMLKKKASISPAMSFLGDTAKKSMGGEMKKGYGAARQSGMGLQDENLTPGKSLDYYKDLM